MKRKVAVLLLAALLLTVSMAMFSGCKDKEPREVEIEIINPLTGEVLEQDGVLELPDEETPIEVRVKDKKKDKYLTDKDLEGVTLKECLNISVSRLWKYDYKEALNTKGKFPIEEEGVVTSNYYEIEVKFETKPWDVFEEEYERKYEAKNLILNFYSNKDWRGTDYFETVLEKGDVVPWDVDRFPVLNIILENEQDLVNFIKDQMRESHCDRIKESIQSLEKYNEEYFKEKSLFLMTFILVCRIDNAAKMVINNGILTLTRVNPPYDGPECPALSYEGIQVIEIDKSVLENIQTIKVEEVRR